MLSATEWATLTAAQAPYTIGQRGTQGPQNTQFQKFSEMTGKRVGFPWDLALILPINVGDQGDPGSRGMHTLVVFGGISTVRIATKTFWTVVAAFFWRNWSHARHSQIVVFSAPGGSEP